MTHQTDMFEIIPELEALELHFRTPLTGAARDRWLVDWTRDLGEFSLEQIKAGCKHWRQTGEKFPRVAELMRVIRNSAKLDGAKKLPGWEPLSQEEFDALDLPEKIRQHKILAAEAYRKAGPMYRNTSGTLGLRAGASGDHLTLEEMSDDWHHWTKVAHEHEAEAATLTARLKGRDPNSALMPLPKSLAPLLDQHEVAERLRRLETVPMDDVGVVL